MPLQLPLGTVDLEARVLAGPSGPVVLTRIEADLLAYLAATDERPVPREELLERVWGYAPGARSRTVDTTVQRLRAKIEADPEQPAVLVTVRGRGYQLCTGASAAASKPATTAPIPRLDRLVGRDDELRAIVAALHGGDRLVTLTGPSGVGKTTIARRALTEVADAGRRAVWFADASAAGRAGELLAVVADALQLPATVIDAVQLGAVLAGLGAAVGVVDDVQGLDDDALRVLSGWIRAAPELALLLTSQRVLGLEGERRVGVEPLPADDAVALLRQRLGALDLPVPPSDALRALVDRVGRLPLAIDLVAPLLDVSTIPALLAREDLLSLGVDGPDRPARHRTLGTAVAASVASLDPGVRDLLVRLAVFEGPFPPEAAAEVATASTEGLAALRRRSLLQRLPDGRLALYEAVRAWARAEGLPIEVVEAHARFLSSVQSPDDWLADLRQAFLRGPFARRVELARVLHGVVGGVRSMRSLRPSPPG